MSILPTTTCRRCHRPYSGIKPRCPYCGTKKEASVRQTMPTSDSSVPGTQASRRAADNIQMQTTIGGVLLLLIMIVTIAMVSNTVSRHVELTDEETYDTEIAATPAVEEESVAEPEVTAEPTPTPVTVTSLAICYAGVQKTDVTTAVGNTLEFECTVYPANIEVEIVWESSDESVATVDQNGAVTVVGTGATTITATAGGQTAECIVRGKS